MIDRNSFEPLYVQVKNDIIADIENGKIKIGDKLKSENEMLQYYGVGRMTIRAALSELVADGCVKKEQGLGSFCVAMPKKARRLNIDVLLDSGDTYFVPAYVLKGISPVLEKNNCNLLLHDTKRSMPHIAELLTNILARGTDGVMLQPISGMINRSPEMDTVMEQYQRAGVPVVVLLGMLPYDNCMNLKIDEVYGSEIAAQYLLECGHRKILGLFYEPDRDPSKRLEGFRNAMCRMTDVETYEITSAEAYDDTILQLVRERKITAIQCYNDRVAVDCMRLLVENGFRVPQDVSLVGFDDSELSSNAIPRLTTLTHPKDHLGSAAANAILRWIQNPGEKQEDMLYRPGLVIRQSVREL